MSTNTPTATETPGKWVSVADAAKALNVSERQARRWAAKLADSDRQVSGVSSGRARTVVRLEALEVLAGKRESEPSGVRLVTGKSPDNGGELSGSDRQMTGHLAHIEKRLDQIEGAVIGGVLQAIQSRLEGLPTGDDLTKAVAAIRQDIASETKKAVADGIAQAVQDGDGASREDMAALLTRMEAIEAQNRALMAELSKAREIEAQRAPEPPKQGFWARLKGNR